jgi:hypothetical protein
MVLRREVAHRTACSIESLSTSKHGIEHLEGCTASAEAFNAWHLAIR